MQTKTTAWLIPCLVAALASCQGGPRTTHGAHLHPGSGFRPWPVPTPAVEQQLNGLIQGASGGPHNRRLSVWLGNADGAALYRWQAETPRGAASAIKTAYLVEWFATHAGSLDKPLPEVAELLQNPNHPAIEHFDGPTQGEIQRDLSNATVRTLGYHMIQGRGVSNAVYNAAANVITALLGGPDGLTARIRERLDGTGQMTVRRYMLADRNVTGDNTMTAASLGHVLQQIADRRISGLGSAPLESARRVLEVAPSKWLGRHFYKSGSLDSEPQVRIRSGWFEQDDRCLVYVVMAQQTRPASGPSAAGEEMGEAVAALTDKLIEAIQAPITTRR